MRSTCLRTFVVPAVRGGRFTVGVIVVFPFREGVFLSISLVLICCLGIITESKDEMSVRSTHLDFRAVIGPKYLNQGMKTFDNNLFVPNFGNADLGPSNGSRITKTNGCLERCKEKSKMVIPAAMIAKDVEYFLDHSLYCMFLEMRVSLQFLEVWA